MAAINRKQLIGLAVLLVLIGVLAECYVPPPAHEIHSGGSPISVAAYASNTFLRWQPGQLPTQSLDQVRCVWVETRAPCSTDQITVMFPRLKQTAQTIYYVWGGCPEYEVGPAITWRGYNVEYFAGSRVLVLHCYAAEGLYVPRNCCPGVGPEPDWLLLAIPTASIGRGPLHLQENDTVEHWIGDQTTQFDIATMTIS